LYLGILILSITSCSTDKKEKKYYRVEKYYSGNIKEKRFYNNQYEYDLRENFICYSYYENGIIKEKTNYKNNLKDGTSFIYDESGQLVSIDTYKNGKRHGLSITYNIDGEIISKILFLNNQKVRWQGLTYIEETKSYQYTIFRVDSDNTLGDDIGAFLIDSEYNPIVKFSNYYVLNSKSDTIYFNNNFEFEIQLLLSNHNITNNEIIIGEINSAENFTDSTSTSNYHFGNDRNLSISVNPTKFGTNLLLGKIYITQDSITYRDTLYRKQEFLLYYEYYVKNWSVMPRIFNDYFPN